LLLGLRHDLINAGAQVEIGAVQRLFRWQQSESGAAAGSLFFDGVG
jgi:hypothetical protein